MLQSTIKAVKTLFSECCVVLSIFLLQRIRQCDVNEIGVFRNCFEGFGKLICSHLKLRLCLHVSRVSSPKIGVCSRIAISSTLYLPNNKIVSICCTLPPSQSLKSTQRVARTLYTRPSSQRQHNLPLILPYSQRPKLASKFTASTRIRNCYFAYKT